MDNIIMHIDVNNAFLSWTAVELLKQGYKTDIRKIEAIIGGDETKRHGIVLAKSMPAKKKGVKTAETIRDAKRKCNNLNIFSPNYSLYNKMSYMFINVISQYTPDIEQVSIDECFIDYSKVKNLYGDPIKFAYKLKDEIKSKLGFTVNIGIANNKLCAKMASDFTKPDRVHTLFLSEVKDKMYPLPIENLFGVGKSTSKRLRELNINTIGDLARYDYNKLYKYFKNQASKLVDSANGIDNSIVMTERTDKVCISNSTTTSYNLTTLNQIYKTLLPLVENVSMQLRKKEKYASVVGVMLKDKTFKTYHHQKTLKNPTNNTDEIYKVSKELVCEMWNEEGIRLVGVSLSKISNNLNYQLSMFESIEKKEHNDELEKTIDKLKELYGSNIVINASKKV